MFQAALLHVSLKLVITETIMYLVNYFSHLFAMKVQHTYPDILQKVQRKVTDQMDVFLLASLTNEDVKKAVCCIGDFKAPGPDGLHTVFL